MHHELFSDLDKTLQTFSFYHPFLLLYPYFINFSHSLHYAVASHSEPNKYNKK